MRQTRASMGPMNGRTLKRDDCDVGWLIWGRQSTPGMALGILIGENILIRQRRTIVGCYLIDKALPILQVSRNRAHRKCFQIVELAAIIEFKFDIQCAANQYRMRNEAGQSTRAVGFRCDNV